MILTVRVDLKKEELKKLHQLHDQNLTSILEATVDGDGLVTVKAETILTEADLIDKLKKFKAQKDKSDLLKEKVKDNTATMEERVYLLEIFAGIRKDE
jgi:hypothetical protein